MVASSFVKRDASSVENRTPTITPGGDINEKDVPISFPSWKEIAALLKKVPCFTIPEPPAPSIDAIFSLTCHHFVDLLGDSRISGMVHLPHGTPESVLQCTYLTQKYTIKETVEVVRFAQCSALTSSSMLFQGVVDIRNLMRQRNLLFKLLETVETMLEFLTQRIDNDEELCAQFIRVESELTAARKATVDGKKLLKETEEEKQMANVETFRMRKEKEIVEAKCKNAEDEIDRLKKQLEKLRAASEAQKKRVRGALDRVHY